MLVFQACETETDKTWKVNENFWANIIFFIHWGWPDIIFCALSIDCVIGKKWIKTIYSWMKNQDFHLKKLTGNGEIIKNLSLNFLIRIVIFLVSLMICCTIGIRDQWNEVDLSSKLLSFHSKSSLVKSFNKAVSTSSRETRSDFVHPT